MNRLLMMVTAALLLGGCRIRIAEPDWEPVRTSNAGVSSPQPHGSDVLEVKEIKAGRVYAREIHAKEIHADRARIGRIVKREPRGKWAKGEIKQDEVSAEIIRCKEIHADYVEADVVYAHEVHIGD